MGNKIFYDIIKGEPKLKKMIFKFWDITDMITKDTHDFTSLIKMLGIEYSGYTERLDLMDQLTSFAMEYVGEYNPDTGEYNLLKVKQLLEDELDPRYYDGTLNFEYEIISMTNDKGNLKFVAEVEGYYDNIPLIDMEMLTGLNDDWVFNQIETVIEDQITEILLNESFFTVDEIDVIYK